MRAQAGLKNWIDQGRLPAVRIGRRVRVRRADLDRVLAQGATAVVEPQASTLAPAEAVQQLTEAWSAAAACLTG